MKKETKEYKQFKLMNQDKANALDKEWELALRQKTNLTPKKKKRK